MVRPLQIPPSDTPHIPLDPPSLLLPSFPPFLLQKTNKDKKFLKKMINDRMKGILQTKN